MATVPRTKTGPCLVCGKVDCPGHEAVITSAEAAAAYRAACERKLIEAGEPLFEDRPSQPRLVFRRSSARATARSAAWGPLRRPAKIARRIRSSGGVPLLPAPSIRRPHGRRPPARSSPW